MLTQMLTLSCQCSLLVPCAPLKKMSLLGRRASLPWGTCEEELCACRVAYVKWYPRLLCGKTVQSLPVCVVYVMSIPFKLTVFCICALLFCFSLFTNFLVKKLHEMFRSSAIPMAPSTTRVSWSATWQIICESSGNACKPCWHPSAPSSSRTIRSLASCSGATAASIFVSYQVVFDSMHQHLLHTVKKTRQPDGLMFFRTV